jgi:hypothetical protein
MAGALGAMAGALGATPADWGLQPARWRSRSRGGGPAAGLANRHAALVEGRQRGQDRRPQPWVVAERRDALGKD